MRQALARPIWAGTEPEKKTEPRRRRSKVAKPSEHSDSHGWFRHSRSWGSCRVRPCHKTKSNKATDGDEEDYPGKLSRKKNQGWGDDSVGKITGLCKTQEPEFRPHHPCKKARHGHVLLEPPCHVGQRQEDCLTGCKASSRFSERLFPRNRAGSDKAGHLADSSGFCTYMYAHITLTHRHIHAHTLTQRCTKKIYRREGGMRGKKKGGGNKTRRGTRKIQLLPLYSELPGQKAMWPDLASPLSRDPFSACHCHQELSCYLVEFSSSLLPVFSPV